MKRPFAIFGSAYFTGLLAAVFLPSSYFPLLLIVTSILFLVSLLLPVLRKNGYIPSAALCFFAAVLVFMLYDSWLQQNISAFEDKSLYVSAEIEEAEENDGSYSYTLNNLCLRDGTELKGKAMLYSYSPLYCKTGYAISAKLDFKSFSDDFGFSSKKYHYSQGEYLSAVINSKSVPVITPEESELYSVKLREKFGSVLSKYLNTESAAISSAMLLGIRPQDDIYGSFKNAGVNHLLVVSGLHMAILAGIILKLLRKLRIPSLYSSLLTILFILIYISVTGFRHSAVRAGIMYICILSASIFGREGDSLNSLGLAVLIVCLISPYAAGDTGFMLSVAATLGILLLSGRISAGILRPFNPAGRIFPMLKYIAELFAVSVSANIFVSPILLLSNGYIKPEGIFYSMILSLPAAAIIFCSLAVCIVGSIPIISGIAYPFALADGVLCKLSSKICATADSRAFTAGSSAFVVFMGILLIAALLLPFKLRKKNLIAALLAVVLIFTGSFTASYIYSSNATRLIIAGSSGGYFTAVLRNGEAAILSMEGKSYEIASELLAESCVKHIRKAYFVSGSYGELNSALSLRADFGSFPQTIQSELLPLGRDFKADSSFDKKLSEDVFGDRAVLLNIEDSGRRMKLDILGKKIIIDRKGVYASPESPDIYISPNAGDEISSAFTILQSDDIINEKSAVPAGNYTGIKNGEIILIDFTAESGIRIRRERR